MPRPSTSGKACEQAGLLSGPEAGMVFQGDTGGSPRRRAQHAPRLGCSDASSVVRSAHRAREGGQGAIVLFSGCSALAQSPTRSRRWADRTQFTQPKPGMLSAAGLGADRRCASRGVPRPRRPKHCPMCCCRTMLASVTSSCDIYHTAPTHSTSSAS